MAPLFSSYVWFNIRQEVCNLPVCGKEAWTIDQAKQQNQSLVLRRRSVYVRELLELIIT